MTDQEFAVLRDRLQVPAHNLEYLFSKWEKEGTSRETIQKWNKKGLLTAIKFGIGYIPEI